MRPRNLILRWCKTPYYILVTVVSKGPSWTLIGFYRCRLPRLWPILSTEHLIPSYFDGSVLAIEAGTTEDACGIVVW